MNTAEYQLVEKARLGSDEAFSELMDQYMNQVYGIALRIVRNPSVAEEITQDVFLSVFRQIKKFRGDSAFSTWLYRITVNSALRTVRKESRYLPIDDGLTLDNQQDARPDPEVIAMENEHQQRIRTLMSQLPAQQRAVLALRIERALPFKEIAGIMGRSIGGVKANYFHAIQKLKAAWIGKEVTNE
ncbi:sigma-70 family RNA polymerase sigma factor [bacterium]|nr:sigma-70 family RNA polymerase sigma factor [candidate division CSSED10-310 bacterium]